VINGRWRKEGEEGVGGGRGERGRRREEEEGWKGEVEACVEVGGWMWGWEIIVKLTG